MALLEALAADAFYVGALGSQRNQDARKKRLAEHFGISAAQLARLHGPVGLRIGARTPTEIAIAIWAEIIQVKNQRVAASAHTPSNGCTVGR
jgi:xanthine dehydrogenase accessory factor